MHRIIPHALLLSITVRMILGSVSAANNYEEGFRFSLVRSPNISSKASPVPPSNDTETIPFDKKKLNNAENKIKQQQQRPKNNHLDTEKRKKSSIVDRNFSLPSDQQNTKNNFRLNSRINSSLPGKPKKGRIFLDFGTGANNGDVSFARNRPVSNLLHGTTSKFKEKMISFHDPKIIEAKKKSSNYDHNYSVPRESMNNSNDDTNALLSRNVKVQVSLDPASACRFFPVLFGAFSNGVYAFFGTLRFLAPLVLGRRAVNGLGGFISDYMTGRYFRKTYTYLERAFLHFYEMPAALRATCRTTAQIIIYYILSKIMTWLVGIDHPPCHSDGRGLATFCASLYIIAVLGTGHAFTTWVSVWGGPLRIQAANDPKKHPTLIEIISRPWEMFRWLVDPEEWLSKSSVETKPHFDPNPLLFPATWIPLHILHIYAISKVLATDPDQYTMCYLTENQIPVILKQFFLQQSLCDEWCRVFLGEMRVGLGIAVIVLYFITLVWSVITSARLNAKMALFMLPSVIAVIISAWMNIIIYCNRVDIRQRRRKRPHEDITLL